MADPSDRADEAAVFWHPEASAAVIPMVPSPIVTPATLTPLAQWPGEIARREAEDGLHVLVKDDASNYQLWLIETPNTQRPLAAVIPLDETGPHRKTALGRFWRFLTGRSKKERAEKPRANRLVTTLRALDGRMAGATYRAIAEALFGKARVDAEPWKTASIRDTIIRAARNGFGLKRGGYRDLLRPRQAG